MRKRIHLSHSKKLFDFPDHFILIGGPIFLAKTAKTKVTIFVATPNIQKERAWK